MAKKKAYYKPEIKQVELVPEEAVLTPCKLKQAGARTIACDRDAGACQLSGAGS